MENPEGVSRRTGVTLIELMVALVLTGLILASARQVLNQLEDSGRVLAIDARRADSRSNRERLLRALLGRVEAKSDSLRRFRGDEKSASFDSWCERPAGWLERCRVDLTVGTAGDSSAVSANLSTGEVLLLRVLAGRASFKYFGRDSLGVRWTDVWGTSLTTPFALGLARERDTIVIRIAERVE